MNEFAGSRVLLLDDRAEEAVPVINAFSRKGIGVVYFDGRPEGLPKKSNRLKGIRLAVLDIDLGEGGSGNTVPATLVQRLAQILSPDNGPYAVVLWTNHEEYRDKIKEYLFKHGDLPNPLFTEMITKAECRNGEQFSLDQVEARISQALDRIGPLRILQAWEGGCFEAATAVTNALAGVSKQTGGDLDGWSAGWATGMHALLRAIAGAKLEKHLAEASCADGVFTTLNPLHADRMETLLPSLAGSVSQHGRDIMNAAGAITLDQKAKINTMLHVGLRDLPGFAPGNMYVFSGKRKPKWIPKCTQLLEGFVQTSGSDEQVAQRKEEVCSAAFQVVVEISAVCDYAQKKLQSARLLPGLLIPDRLKSRINVSVQFMKGLGPVFLETARIPKGVYYLFFSSRQVLSPDIGLIARLRPFAQMRSQGLSDLQSWFAYQAGRQGVTLLK